MCPRECDATCVNPGVRAGVCTVVTKISHGCGCQKVGVCFCAHVCTLCVCIVCACVCMHANVRLVCACMGVHRCVRACVLLVYKATYGSGGSVCVLVTRQLCVTAAPEHVPHGPQRVAQPQAAARGRRLAEHLGPPPWGSDGGPASSPRTHRSPSCLRSAPPTGPYAASGTSPAPPRL